MLPKKPSEGKMLSYSMYNLNKATSAIQHIKLPFKHLSKL